MLPVLGRANDRNGSTCACEYAGTSSSPKSEPFARNLRFAPPLGVGHGCAPFPEEIGSAVLPVTIDRYGSGSRTQAEDRKTTVRSVDHCVFAKYWPEKPAVYDGELDLENASKWQPGDGLEVTPSLRSDAPPFTSRRIRRLVCFVRESRGSRRGTRRYPSFGRAKGGPRSTHSSPPRRSQPG